jgi:hypothetical protein
MTLPSLCPNPSDAIQVNGRPVPASSVQLIIGESGLSFSGGEMLIWKRTVVVAAGVRYVTRGTPADHESNFTRWLAACPRAVGIRPDGSVTLPRIDPADAGDPLELLGAALAAVKRELGTQILRGLAAAAVCLITGIALMVAIAVYNAQNPKELGGFKLGIAGLVLVVCAFLLGGRVLWLSGRKGRIQRVLRELMQRGELNAPLLAQAIAPPPTPADRRANPAPPSNFVPAALSIVGICTSFCPFVGWVFPLIALLLTYRKPSWVRVLSIISLIISVLVNVLAIVMIATGH